jgi:phosphoadenosine phosphosulfate reductase
VLELNAYSKEKIMLNNDNDHARRMLETCTLKGKHILNPVVDFTLDEVWEYLKNRDISYCCLYDEGFRRIGCIGCPNQREKTSTRSRS